jgi:hypothetical protein
LEVERLGMIKGIVLHSGFTSGLRVMTDNRILGR